jgi:hypothetical protein
MARIPVYPAGTVVTVAWFREPAKWESAKTINELYVLSAGLGQGLIHYVPDEPMLTLVPLSWSDKTGQTRLVPLLTADGRVGSAIIDRLRFTDGPGRRA